MLRFLGMACLLLVCVPCVHAQPSRNPQGTRVAHLLERGERLVAAGNPVSALAYFRDAVRAAPNDPRGYEALGQSYLAARQAKDALEVFEAGVRRRPDVAALWIGLARALEMRGEPERAAGALRQYAARDPGHVEIQLARARLAEQRGAWSEALASYRAAAERLSRNNDVDTLHATRLRVRALEVLVGEVDPVRADRNCKKSSVVRRALAGC